MAVDDKGLPETLAGRDIVEDVAAYCAGSPIRLLTP